MECKELQMMELSERGKTVQLVKRAMIYFHRAVRLGDVLEYKVISGDFPEITEGSVSTLIAKVVYSGQLYLAKEIRKDKFGGCFYLPTAIEGNNWLNNLPETWLELVQNCFRELWQKNLTEAYSKGFLPEPLSTKEVRDYIVQTCGKNVLPTDMAFPVNYALRYLCEEKNCSGRQKTQAGYFRWLSLDTFFGKGGYV
jgi:hypothetical protein